MANQAGRTPFAAKRKETPPKIEDYPWYNVSDSPDDDSKICKLPSKISINIDHRNKINAHRCSYSLFHGNNNIYS